MSVLLLASATLPGCFVAHLVLERTWFRRHPPRSRQKVVALIGLTITGLATGLAALLSGSVLSTIYVLVVASGLAHLYFHIFNFTETARRIRILVATYLGEELGAYGPGVMIEERVERLAAMGSVVETGGRYRAARGIMLLAAFAFDGWGKLFSIETPSLPFSPATTVPSLPVETPQ